TTAYGVASHTEGNLTSASGDFSHTEGDSTTSIGQASHAEGYATTTMGHYSHTNGVQSNTSYIAQQSYASGGFNGTIGSAQYAQYFVSLDSSSTDPQSFYSQFNMSF